MLHVTAYCAKWHLDESSAFRDLVVDPLKPFMNVRLREWSEDCVSEQGPRVFCMNPPPPSLLANAREQLIWVPMWDNLLVKGYGDAWWKGLPKSLRIVSLSERVAERSEKVGLKTLRLKYHCDPSRFTPCSWENGRVLMYWNRRGLFDRRALERFCASLEIAKVLFRERLDPGVPRRRHYRLPSRIADAEVETIPDELSREDYFARTAPANIFIAPRAREGAGMIYLEALARGGAVFAVNAATMNEYIEQGRNGYLFSASGACSRLGAMWRNGFSRFCPFIRRVHEFPFDAKRQDWQTIAGLDVEAMGKQALGDHQRGHAEWSRQVEAYAAFVQDW